VFTPHAAPNLIMALWYAVDWGEPKKAFDNAVPLKLSIRMASSKIQSRIAMSGESHSSSKASVLC
jgi:hypothetical protein